MKTTTSLVRYREVEDGLHIKVYKKPEDILKDKTALSSDLFGSIDLTEDERHNAGMLIEAVDRQYNRLKSLNDALQQSDKGHGQERQVQ